MEEKRNFWMVVWHVESGDFKNVKFSSSYQDDEVINEFESTHPDFKVIHMGQGELPPKAFRSLEYVR